MLEAEDMIPIQIQPPTLLCRSKCSGWRRELLSRFRNLQYRDEDGIGTLAGAGKRGYWPVEVVTPLTVVVVVVTPLMLVLLCVTPFPIVVVWVITPL